jgi:hypothetical protein
VAAVGLDEAAVVKGPEDEDGFVRLIWRDSKGLERGECGDGRNVSFNRSGDPWNPVSRWCGANSAQIEKERERKYWGSAPLNNKTCRMYSVLKAIWKWLRSQIKSDEFGGMRSN